jgi:glutamate racemase
MKKKATVLGVFDSGLGGLTVLKEIIKNKYYSKIIYLGDTGRVPYGTRSRETIIKYARQDIRFLLAKGANEIIIACGTVSSIAIDVLKNEFDVLITGMIEFTAKEAVIKTNNNIIGVIGTQATINNNAYERQIKKMNEKIKLINVACPLFVPLVEYGFLKEKQIIESVCDFYLSTVKFSEADTLIMGCTHYPILKEYFKNYFDHINLIDMGESVLKNLNMQRKYDEDLNVAFYVTDAVDSFIQGASLFFGDITLENVTLVKNLNKYN